MKIIPLSEGAFTIDATKKFIPFNPDQDNLQNRTTGSLLVEIQPFLVITSRDILLFDTGLGFKLGEVLQLHSIMQQHGVGAGEVTKVLLSHLHKDHSGGISLKDKDGQSKLAFPNATYYVQQGELDFALYKNSPSYLKEDVAILENNPQTVLLDGSGNIDECISYELTGAHCPFHQVFWIKEDGETVFFGGDDAPQLGQMRKRYIAKYDYDGRKCMELRHMWWERGEQEKWTFLFYHDVKAPTCSFT